MSSDRILDQAEIDALLGKNDDFGESAEGGQGLADLSSEEKDVLGEIGNISMGAASTTLSMLLNRKVIITSPQVNINNYNDLMAAFAVPYITIRVEFIEGLKGFNLLVMKLEDAMVVADLMMGGDGSKKNEELTDIEVSAASEAMNQMIGTSATSLATMFGKTINISPPVTEIIKEGHVSDAILGSDALVVVSFRMTIGELVDTEIMQIMGIETAKKEVELLLPYAQGMGEVPSAESHYSVLNQELDIPLKEPVTVSTNFSGEADSQEEVTIPNNKDFSQGSISEAAPVSAEAYSQQRLDLILDIPLKVSVVLGSTKRPIKEVLTYSPGSVVELSTLIDEPVDIMINGTLVAKGEVVVVNENFGVKITSIISPSERLQYLANK